MLTDPHTQSVIDQFHAKSGRYNPMYDLESAAANMRYNSPVTKWVFDHRG